MKVFSHHFVNQLIRGAENVDLGVAISDKYDFFSIFSFPRISGTIQSHSVLCSHTFVLLGFNSHLNFANTMFRDLLSFK